MTVVVPGKKKASILFGVIKILEARYAIRRIITGISNLPIENSSEPFRITLIALISNAKPTPKVRIISLGNERGFGKTERTKRGIKKMVV